MSAGVWSRRGDSVSAHPPLAGETAAAGLTDRDVEILQAVANGEHYELIARRLFMGHSYLSNYAARLFRRLGARSQAHAVAIALRRGVIR